MTDIYNGLSHHLSSHDSKALNAESNYLASRCSARLVYDVVSKFGDQKKEIVKSLGFEGMLHFPPIKTLNRKLSAWLLSKVDLASQSLVFGPHKSIRFGKEDVRKVFGIPCGGKKCCTV